MATAVTISETRVTGISLVMNLEQAGKLLAILATVNPGDSALRELYLALFDADCEFPKYARSGSHTIHVHKVD